IARLVSEATKDLKLAGVSKNDPIIEINNRRLGLQQVSRRLRRARIQLDNNIAAMTTGHGHIQSIDGSNQGEIGTDLGKSPGDESIQNGGAIAAIITAGIALLGLLPDLFNQTDDDDARTRIAGASHEQIRDMDENELVSMINAMIDGPTGDDDEDAILKILEA